MAEKLLFPMSTMRITTGVDMLSHKGSNAIDNGGKDTGKDDVFAPFTGTIKKIYTNGNTVWLQSNDPVEFADGTVDYATANFTHDNIVSDLKVGQVIKQGQVFYQEGTANASANHVHIEIGKGKFTGAGWYQNKYGNWVINNSYAPWNAFWLKNVNVINGMNYPWKVLEEQAVRKMNKDELVWNYYLIGGYKPSEAELKVWLGPNNLTYKDYDAVNEEMKTFFETRDAGYYQYRFRAEEEIKKLKDQLGSSKPGEAEKKLQAIKDALK